MTKSEYFVFIISRLDPSIKGVGTRIERFPWCQAEVSCLSTHPLFKNFQLFQEIWAKTSTPQRLQQLQQTASQHWVQSWQSCPFEGCWGSWRGGWLWAGSGTGQVRRACRIQNTEYKIKCLLKINIINTNKFHTFLGSIIQTRF